MWKFLNRYAGLRWAWQSRGAWIGFRDGLDVLDTQRFSEAHYGSLQMSSSGTEKNGYPSPTSSQLNRKRALAVCAAHEAQGCRVDVPANLLSSAMGQRRMRGMNDVAFGNWRDDYGGFMRQLRPRSSRGWWRIGAHAELFGRFGRGFADPTNTSAVIALGLDQGLWGGLPLAAADKRQLTVRLVFLDVGLGAFSIGYDAQAGPRTLARIVKSDSGRWRELCAPVSDGRFAGRGPDGADVWLANVDAKDDVFDSVEVAEGKSQDLALASCDWQPTPGPSS